MKIVHIVLKAMPMGTGIEKYTEEIGSRLAAKGHDVIVYTMQHYGSKESVYRGMKIKKIPTIRRRSLEKITASFVATLCHLFEEEVDIVHLHALSVAAPCFLPRIFRPKTRVVVQGHGIEWRRAKWGALNRLFIRMLEYPSVIFPHRLTVVSEVQRRYLLNKYGIESEVITTGINPPVYRPADIIVKEYKLEPKRFVLFASRLVREKNAHGLIKAFRRVNTDMKLVIAGDAPYEEDYKKSLFEAAHGDSRIIFTGFVEGPPLQELFSNAYLFVLPSDLEGLPTVLLEAMSYGLGCVASDIEENKEALGGNGFTFRAGDVDSLRETLQELVDNSDIVSQGGEESVEYVLANFSWDKIAVKMEALYDNLMVHVPRGRGERKVDSGA